MTNLKCLVLSWFTLFWRKINFVAIYTLLCGAKINQQILSVEEKWQLSCVVGESDKGWSCLSHFSHNYWRFHSYISRFTFVTWLIHLQQDMQLDYRWATLVLPFYQPWRTHFHSLEGWYVIFVPCEMVGTFAEGSTICGRPWFSHSYFSHFSCRGAPTL